MPYATELEAREFYAGDRASSLEIDVTLNAAARLVARFAPPPNPVTTDYEQAARDTELLVARYLSSTQMGALSSQGAGGVSESFADSYKVFDIIRQAMGNFAISRRSGVLRSFPIARG